MKKILLAALLFISTNCAFAQHHRIVDDSDLSHFEKMSIDQLIMLVMMRRYEIMEQNVRVRAEELQKLNDILRRMGKDIDISVLTHNKLLHMTDQRNKFDDQVHLQLRDNKNHHLTLTLEMNSHNGNYLITDFR